jgi:hypothetical protein
MSTMTFVSAVARRERGLTMPTTLPIAQPSWAHAGPVVLAGLGNALRGTCANSDNYIALTKVVAGFAGDATDVNGSAPTSTASPPG